MWWGGNHNGNGTGTTTALTPMSTANSTDFKFDEYQPVGEATTPVLACILVLILIMGVAVFIYLRVRRRRLAVTRRESQLRISTTNNAGVYVDLSIDGGPEHDLFTAKQRPPRDIESQTPWTSKGLH